MMTTTTTTEATYMKTKIFDNKNDIEIILSFFFTSTGCIVGVFLQLAYSINTGHV